MTAAFASYSCIASAQIRHRSSATSHSEIICARIRTWPALMRPKNAARETFILMIHMRIRMRRQRGLAIWKPKPLSGLPSELPRHVAREIGDDPVGAGTFERREGFGNHAFPIEPAAFVPRHQHRIFARHLIDDRRHPDAVFDAYQH